MWRITVPKTHPWRRPLTAVAVLAALVALTLTPLSASVHPGHGRQKPTIVLVHGAWADGSSWNAITNAAAGNADVTALVYVDAFLPDENETVLPLAGPDSALAGDPTTIFDFVPYPNAPPGDVDLYLKRDTFLTSFANGVPRRQAEVLYAAQRPFAFSAGNQPSGVPAWRSVPSWAVVGTQDKVIPPSAQLSMATWAHARITQVKGGHLALVTKAAAVSDVIESAARRTT
jgi:pimeloyl-ACP methyl ester carboxylesterase